MHDFTLLLAVIAVILLALQADPQRKSAVSNAKRMASNAHRRVSEVKVNEATIAVLVFTLALVTIVAMMVFSW